VSGLVSGMMMVVVGTITADFARQGRNLWQITIFHSTRNGSVGLLSAQCVVVPVGYTLSDCFLVFTFISAFVLRGHVSAVLLDVI